MNKYFGTLYIKKIKRLLRSKAFLGSFLFAISLWGYTSLNHEYMPFVKVPLSVKPPVDKAIENPLPESISIKVKGGGWQLFYLFFFNNVKQCVIDLSSKYIAEDEYIVSRTDILKGIQNIVDVEPIDVFPESMKLKLGKIGTYKVPVNPIISITPRAGFIAMSNISLEPDSIQITGNDRVVKNIKSWNTKKIEFTGINKTSTMSVPLSDSLSSIVKLSQTYINIKVNVQQEADLTIYDLPIFIKGGTMPRNHRIVPAKINVTIHGGVEQLANLVIDNITPYIDYEELINDTTGIITPKVSMDGDLHNFYIKPGYIYHYRQVKTIN
jgi:hypothetical protein